jgi:hypothetical protein
MDYTTHSLMQMQWMSASNAARFAYVECREATTWEAIMDYTPARRSLFTTGGLSVVSSVFQVWACWQQHSCLSRIPHSEGDAMCYVYNEHDKTWLPWDLKSSIKLGPDCHA